MVLKKKKFMNTIDVYAWVNIYGKILENTRINNIYNVKNKYWLFKILTSKGKKFLKIEPEKRIHISNTEPQHKGIDGFTVILRKHLRNGLIKNVSTLGFERIVYIDVYARGSLYRLYLEVIPRGILVLTRENKIIYSSRFFETRDRIVKPKMTYTPPPLRKNPFDLSIEELRRSLSIGKDLVRGLVIGWGIPGEVAEEMLYRTGLYDVKNVSPEKISYLDIEDLLTNLRKLIQESLSNKGYLVKHPSTDEYISFTPYNPLLYKEIHEFTIVETNDFNSVVDAYFTELERVIEIQENRELILQEVKRLDKSISSQEELIRKYLEKAEKLEKEAQVLALNYSIVQNIIDCVKEARKKSWSEVIECPHVIGYDKNKGIIQIKINNTIVSYDIRYRLDDYISYLYRRSGEYHAKARRAKESLNKLLSKKEEILKGMKIIVEEAKASIKPRYWYERFHWLITSEGYLVIAGRDANQNEALVRKYLEPNDIFMHADIHGAPATIIKTRGKKPTDKSIKEASVIAACYSRAWKEGLGYIDVYWVWGNQVSKSPPPGEYLSKGAFMIYGKRNYVKGVELVLSIGVEEVYDEIYGTYWRVFVGPEELVRDKTLVYAVLTPGDISKKGLAKYLSKKFNEYIGKKVVDEKEIYERIPGNSRILRIEKPSY